MDYLIKRLVLLSLGSLFISGCANTSYQKTMIESDITGFYSYTKSMIGVASVQAVQLNSDGSGFNCSYSVGKPGINKVPIKHIGNNIWASSSFGTAEITKNSDGSISWGPYSTYYPEKIENTNCK
jgi:hypothetical protein